MNLTTKYRTEKRWASAQKLAFELSAIGAQFPDSCKDNRIYDAITVSVIRPRMVLSRNLKYHLELGLSRSLLNLQPKVTPSVTLAHDVSVFAP